MQQWKSVLGLGGITCFLAIGTYSYYKSYRRNCKKHNTILKNKIIDVHQFKSKTKQPGDVYVIRSLQRLKNLKSKKQDFYSNQQLFRLPNEKYQIDAISLQLQNGSKDSKWGLYDIYNNELLKVKGIGKILDGVIEVNIQPIKTISFEQQPFYKKIWIFLTFGLEFIFQLLHFIFKRNIQFLVFKGAKIGELDISYNFVKGNFLVECQISSDGILDVQAVSVSKNLLIQNASLRQRISFTQFLFCAGLCLFTTALLIKQYRKIKQKDVRLRRAQGYRQLQFEPIQQIHTCIICMVNNRNVIFSNCCHLVICSECLPFFDSNQCPLCKTNIAVKKIYTLE